MENPKKSNPIKQNFKKLYEEMNLILDNIPALVFYKDVENNFIRVNKYMARAHNCTKEELQGKNLFDLYPKEEAKKYWEDDKKILREGLPLEDIIEPWETNFGKRWISTSKIPIKDESGKVESILGLGIDITERRKSEIQLKRAEKKFREVLENSISVVYRLDFQNYVYDYISQSVGEVLGFSFDEIKSMGIKKLIQFVHPHDKIRIINSFGDYGIEKRANKFKNEIEFRFKHPDLGYQWLKDHQTIIVNDQGEIEYVVGNIVNVNDQKKAQKIEKDFRNELEARVAIRTAELTEASKTLKNYLDQITMLSQSKADFFRSVSHELRTPFNAIIGFIDLLLEEIPGKINNEQRKMLQDIHQSTNRLLKIIKNILEISDLDSFEKNLDLEILKIHDLIDAFDLIFHNMNDSPEIDFQFFIRTNAQIVIDKQKFMFIIKQLFQYAIQKTAKGKIRLEIDENANDWEFKIAYPNHSQALSDLNNAFLEFSTKKSVEHSNGLSFGLKLPIAKRLIEIQGGKLKFNVSEKGVEFMIELPKL